MVAGQGMRVKLEFRFHPLYSSHPSETINPITMNHRGFLLCHLSSFKLKI
jgi:hypothetical protein